MRSSPGESEWRRARFGVPTGVPVGVLALLPPLLPLLPLAGDGPRVSSTFRNMSLTPTAAEHTCDGGTVGASKDF